jgi:hypothetical protein
MAYSKKAREMRRCKATRKDGQPCQAWALSVSGFFMAHRYRMVEGGYLFEGTFEQVKE